MKILFLAAYSELAASSRTRVYQFLPFFERAGINYRCICFTPAFLHKLSSRHQGLISKSTYYFLGFLIKIISTVFAVFFATNYDIIFIQKIIFPFGLEKLMKLLNKNIIFDFDDAIFTAESEKKDILNNIKSNFQKKGFYNMLRSSKCCLVENEYNKNIALKYCKWVEIITGPIDTEKYFVKDKNTDSKVVVGWTGSAPTARYLSEIKDVLKELSQKYNIILRFIGVGKDFKMDGIEFETKDWSLETEIPLIQTFDVGIMPLPDNDWTRGKGGYKLLQYMACGIPAVASPVEINKEIIKDGYDGFLATNVKEWMNRLSLLVEDRNLRLKMGQAGRKTVEERYSLERASKKMLSLFNSILKDKE